MQKWKGRKVKYEQNTENFDFFVIIHICNNVACINTAVRYDDVYHDDVLQSNSIIHIYIDLDNRDGRNDVSSNFSYGFTLRQTD